MASLRSPIAYATTWRVRRHTASQIQRLFCLDRTNDQSSSSSSTSASAAVAGARVCASGGSCRAFFEPGADRCARDAKDPHQATEGTALVIGRQNFLFARRGIRCAARVFPRGAATLATAKALLAIGRFAMPNEIAAATVSAVDRLCNHVIKHTRTTQYVPLPPNVIHTRSSR